MKTILGISKHPKIHVRIMILAFLTASALPCFAEGNEASSRAAVVKYRTMQIQNVDIAYREAGDPDNPTVLLLHGFPTSSHMFRNLIPILAHRYHVLAPDYPGYGASDMPAVNEFDYSFANFANIIDEFLEKKDIESFAVYVMDYGAPVGFRVFAKHPERVKGFIIQNGNAYEEGLQDFWIPLRAYWKDKSTENAWALRRFFTLGITKWQYTHGVPAEKLDRVSPDNWFHDQFLLDRQGNQEIQLQMFYDYGTNPPEYPKWQKLFRQHQPPALIVWGKNDYIFPESGAHPYERDLTNVEKYIIDTGHFALETDGEFIADKMLDFLGRVMK